MSYNTFTDFINSTRSYNSTSILEVGSQQCWQIWPTQHHEPLNWLQDNALRNYSIRLILLASIGNPHRRNNVSIQNFNNLVDVYFNWDKHTIAYSHILDQEAENIVECIKAWEKNNERRVRNWSLKISDILDLELIRQHMIGLFLQRQVAFQNSGFGKPVARINRTIKFIEFFENQFKYNFSEDFIKSTGLTTKIYFRQFISCLGLFGSSERKGFYDFLQFTIIDYENQKLGINQENIKLFIQQNSAPFNLESENSFRTRVKRTLNNFSEVYKPFFHNILLETPFIEFESNKFCLPDPFSFTESCWNQIESLVLKNLDSREKGNILSDAFEHYLENILFPSIAPNSFQKIPEVKNPQKSSDKRADFIIELSNSYLVIECKNSVMYLDTSAYFHPEGIADTWCKIHSACEQISATVKVLKSMENKPVIPLILTFYDNIVSSETLTQIIKESDYCSRMNLTIPPIVNSLHEFEHRISNRSLDNWAELILQKYKNNSIVKPDNQGHNYKHLEDVVII
ncbi:hypothetical protein VB713_13090 [Anabaena cylindrica UHCC 0172]|uniref:hypothetical protein n=1 Tax=Anabaena cylindrica TaxID=1165 RepID=UPI002B211B3F|nr:hypothetical protein [Anabaena cylindrica]MEA5551881.1 hypothetical protein [Anabaena cylindrica UHCC 0172]